MLKANRFFCKKENPEVGIFWIYHGRIIFKNSVPVEQGIPYGEAINGHKDHCDYWDELDEQGKLEWLPLTFRSEYFSLPRGRVVYHRDTNSFCVLHGNNVSLWDLYCVTKSFNLPKSNTTFEQDIHYFDLSDKEWKDLLYVMPKHLAGFN
ncbi:MAG: hypothetical protein J6B81_03465 [Spirochaetaceae bacterium]|nr:hypothetical protein [Spirochaetaceae bacterium]